MVIEETLRIELDSQIEYHIGRRPLKAYKGKEDFISYNVNRVASVMEFLNDLKISEEMVGYITKRFSEAYRQ